MDSMDYWRLCDELSTIDAALLVIGCDPGQYEFVENWPFKSQPDGFPAAFAAIRNAVLTGRLAAIVRRSAWEKGWDEQPGPGEYYEPTVHLFASDLAIAGVPDLRQSMPGKTVQDRGVIFRAEPDWRLTTVPVEALRKWLASRGFRSGFFFPDHEARDIPEYLDERHPRYASKLAAAIGAWQACTDTEGKSPKQALGRWLRQNAARFDLSDDDGKPNEQGIEECAKVANWQRTGGAPRTPGT